MSELKWYVARVKSCQERKIAESLAAQGLATYVPVQKVKRKWSDRVKIVDKLVLPGLVFIRCDEVTRMKKTFDMVYGICYFLMDRTSDERRALVVPDRQMVDFMRVVSARNGEEDELEFVEFEIAPGDMVRVIRGPLDGMECECAEVQNTHKLIIRLGMLGSALITIDAKDVIRI